MNIRRSLCAIASVAVLVLAAVNSSLAQTLWTDGTGDWNTAANWSLGVPNAGGGSNLDAVVENGGTAQLTGSPAGSVRRLRIGRAAGGGNLIVDAATLNITENLHLNETSSAPASVTVRNGATVTSPSTVVGYSSNFNTNFMITGAGTAYHATTQFLVGNSGAGTASLHVEDGGWLDSAAGFVGNTANAVVQNPNSKWSTTGALTIGNVGTGTLTIQDQGLVSVGTMLTINGGSTVNLNGGTLRFATLAGVGPINYTSGTIQLAGDRTLDSDSTIAYLFGTPITPPSSITIPAGKALTVEGTAYLIQPNKTATISGGSLTSTDYFAGSFSGAVGTVVVNNGGKWGTTSNAVLGDVFGSSGVTTVSGAGSTWTVGGNLSVGLAGTSSLTIQDEALVYVGSALSVNNSSTINLTGGTLRFDTITGTNRLTYSSGTIQLAGNRNIGSDSAVSSIFGAFPVIPIGKGLTVEGNATLSKPLTIDGGAFTANNLNAVAGGSVIFDSGLLEITGGGITGVANLVIPANGELRSNGVQSVRITAVAGSKITATSTLTLGDASMSNGFYCNGDFIAGPNTVTLADANDAVFDSAASVSIGNGMNPGTLSAANGLTLDFGGNISGYGTVSTPNMLAKPLINNGHVTGTSAAEPITLPGYVKGVGTFDNVSFTGTFSPGLSPTILSVGSIALSDSSTLVMELGGTSPGGGYDQIQATGSLALNGTLDLALINDFTPAAGQSFNLFDWSSVNGQFTNLVLPSLAGITWNTSQLYTDGVLSLVAAGLPGDYNQDGKVDAADYTVWRDHLGSDTALANDDTPGVGADDYARWKTHFGEASTGSGAGGAAGEGYQTVAVPEPALLALVLVAACSISIRFLRGCIASTPWRELVDDKTTRCMNLEVFPEVAAQFA